MRRLWSVLVSLLWLAGCSLSITGQDSPPTSTPDFSPVLDSEPLTVAWVDGGDLFTWRSNDPLPRRIASGGVIQPFLSPDGMWVAYLRGPAGTTRSLWISDVPGANERQLLEVAAIATGTETRRLSQVVWAGGALYFNTVVGVGIDARPADDLWRVDVDAGLVERLLPDGEGGMMVRSPDSAQLALVAAGQYTQPGEAQGSPGVVAFYTLASGERGVALEFPAPATASERRWYADPRWLPDGSGVYVAIPPADLVYGGGEAPDTALWWLPVAGDAVQVGAVDADFFGLPTFAADGQWIAYIQRRQTPQQNTVSLILAHSDGTALSVYAEGVIGTLAVPGWLPQGHRFVLARGAPGELWIGEPDGPSSRFPADDMLVNEIVWADAQTYVVSSATGETFTLSFGLLDVPTPPAEIATSSVYPTFDSVLP